MEGAVRSGLNAVIALVSPGGRPLVTQGTNGQASELAENAGTEVKTKEADEREVRS
jgi:hypothetical protein